MDFILRHWLNRQPDSSRTMRWRFGLMGMLLSVPVLVMAQPADLPLAPFIDADMQVQQVDGLLKLSGNLNYQFSKKARDALDNGLPLTVVTNIRIQKPGRWFFQQPLWAASFEQHIHYHALSHQYLVKDVQSDFPRAFLSLETSLEALGKITELELINLKAMKIGERYQVEVETHLDIQSLPTPLRPIAFLSDEWRQQGKWHAWKQR